MKLDRNYFSCALALDWMSSKVSDNANCVKIVCYRGRQLSTFENLLNFSIQVGRFNARCLPKNILQTPAGSSRSLGISPRTKQASS